MNLSKKEKIKLITNLNESELRTNVLIPLLLKMGFIDCIEHHHNNEKGKDIICKEFDERFDKYNYIAVIVKADDITGSASSNNSYFALINQIKQSINDPYKHIYDLNEVYMDQCLIITSGRFLPTALESVYNTLKKENINKVIREAIDINKLIDLIDKYFNEFWDENANEIEIIVNERNILLNNILKLLKVITPEQEITKILAQKITKQDFDIDIDSFYTTSRFIADIRFDKIIIDEIDLYYKDEIFNRFGNIPEETYKIKKSAQDILYEMDEVIEILKKILNERNPEAIVEKWEKLKSYIGACGLQFSTNDIECIESYYWGCRDYKERKDLLIESNLLSIHNKIIKDVETKIYSCIIDFYRKYTYEQKDIWLGYKFKILDKDNSKFDSDVYVFQREIQKINSQFFSEQYEIEKTYKNPEGYLCVECAINMYGVDKKDVCSIAKILSVYFSSNVSKLMSEYDEEKMLI